jgi:hypothetical protein
MNRKAGTQHVACTNLERVDRRDVQRVLVQHLHRRVEAILLREYLSAARNCPSHPWARNDSAAHGSAAAGVPGVSPRRYSLSRWPKTLLRYVNFSCSVGFLHRASAHTLVRRALRAHTVPQALPPMPAHPPTHAL